MKKIFCLLLLTLVTVTMTSCSHIEDTNGEDNYSVVSFTDEDILSIEICQKQSIGGSTIDTTTTLHT